MESIRSLAIRSYIEPDYKFLMQLLYSCSPDVLTTLCLDFQREKNPTYIEELTEHLRAILPTFRLTSLEIRAFLRLKLPKLENLQLKNIDTFFNLLASQSATLKTLKLNVAYSNKQILEEVFKFVGYFDNLTSLEMKLPYSNSLAHDAYMN